MTLTLHVSNTNPKVGEQVALRAYGDASMVGSSCYFMRYMNTLGIHDMTGSGYAAMYWTPTEDDVGTANMYVTCAGATSAAVSVTVEAADIQHCYASFYIRDDNGNPVEGATVVIGDKSATTPSNGGVDILLEVGHTYYATCTPPSGYTCDECTDSFYLDADHYKAFWLIKNEAPADCNIIFTILDVDSHTGIAGAVCHVGGKDATTNSSGSATISVPTGHSYTATCDPPDGYHCAEAATCSDGPTYINAGSTTASVAFNLEKDAPVDEYCQQDFIVLDDAGDPVRGVFLEMEDQSSFIVTPISGHGNSGTLSDGKISTLHTIKGHSYKFDITQFPGGYDVGTVSVIGPITACTDELTFRVKKLVTDTNVNFCVRNQAGVNMPGVAITVDHDIGTLHTKNTATSFGCTGAIGLKKDTSYTATITETAAYSCEVCTKTFTPAADMVVFFDVTDKVNVPPDDYLVITPPSQNPKEFTPFDVGVSYKADTHVTIKRDDIPTDTVIGDCVTDSEGKGTATCTSGVTGKIEIYGCDPSPTGCAKKSVVYQLTVDTVGGGPGDQEFAIKAPRFVMSDSDFDVSGVGGKPGQTIQIKIDKSAAIDPVLASTKALGDGTFTVTTSIPDMSFPAHLYAYDPAWIPGTGKKSAGADVYVMSWLVVGAVVVAVALIYMQKTGKLNFPKR